MPKGVKNEKKRNHEYDKHIFWNMFPLQRKHVNYKSVQIGDLLTHYELPPFQRVKNEQHMIQLYEKVKLYYEKCHDIMFPGTISFGTYEDNLDK